MAELGPLPDDPRFWTPAQLAFHRLRHSQLGLVGAYRRELRKLYRALGWAGP